MRGVFEDAAALPGPRCLGGVECDLIQTVEAERFYSGGLNGRPLLKLLK